MTQWDVARESGGKQPSRISEFERRTTWPRDPDAMVDAYAQALEITPQEIWIGALMLWLEKDPEQVRDAIRDASRSLRAIQRAPQGRRGNSPAADG